MKVERERFYSFSQLNTIDAESIEYYRRYHRRREYVQWNSTSSPLAFALGIPTLTDRYPCKLCCATMDFCVSYQLDATLRRVLANLYNEQLGILENAVHCAEFKARMYYNHLKKIVTEMTCSTIQLCSRAIKTLAYV